MTNRIPAAVLGATGAVGQRFVQLLEDHPLFRIVAVTGSDRSVGSRYGEITRWKLNTAIPGDVAGLEVLPSDPTQVQAPLVFSALHTEKAREFEPQFARAGSAVCSNASAFRTDSQVPLLMPEINPEHTGLIDIQKQRWGGTGFIVTNPNCTSVGPTVVLKALQQEFGVRKAFLVSLQAVSGAGYPGVPSLDMIDNVVPFVDGEEEKVEWEPRKMLGELREGEIHLADIQISAQTNRVPVSDGHLVNMNIKLDKLATAEDVHTTLKSFQPSAIVRNLPSCPQQIIEVLDQEDRPQPRLDRMRGNGMTTVVGRIRTDTILDIRLVVLSHNTIRGAAGASVLNAELLATEGFLS